MRIWRTRTNNNHVFTAFIMTCCYTNSFTSVTSYADVSINLFLIAKGLRTHKETIIILVPELSLEVQHLSPFWIIVTVTQFSGCFFFFGVGMVLLKLLVPMRSAYSWILHQNTLVQTKKCLTYLPTADTVRYGTKYSWAKECNLHQFCCLNVCHKPTVGSREITRVLFLDYR
jgi:hypothetical protein